MGEKKYLEFYKINFPRQLAHAENDSTRTAYHRSDFWDERVEIMHWWAEWLDNTKRIK